MPFRMREPKAREAAAAAPPPANIVTRIRHPGGVRHWVYLLNEAAVVPAGQLARWHIWKDGVEKTISKVDLDADELGEAVIRVKHDEGGAGDTMDYDGPPPENKNTTDDVLQAFDYPVPWP